MKPTRFCEHNGRNRVLEKNCDSIIILDKKIARDNK